MNFFKVLQNNNSVIMGFIKLFLAFGLFFLLMLIAIPSGFYLNDLFNSIFGFTIPFLVIMAPPLLGFILTIYFAYWIFNIKKLVNQN